MATATTDPVSIAILILLMVISCALLGYVVIFIYTRYKRSRGEDYYNFDLFQNSFLHTDRKPLIPGSVHTRTIQPLLNNDNETDEDDVLDEVDHFKGRDYSKLGRIIFVMRYNKKRQELMVRLVQIEGLPVSQELYSPNSAYVDVQLKYNGNYDVGDEEVNQPPRLDICLQQVYYFIITTQQMMSHSLEFQINTFDEQFRRYVSGVVEVNLCQELGEDILTGSEVVFVKEILEPFRYSEDQKFDEDDFVSAVSDFEDKGEENIKEEEEEEYQKEEKVVSRASSQESIASSRASNMSWEPEVSQDLLTISMNSLLPRCISEQDLSLNPLTQWKRSHSVGYLPTYEWTVKEISLDDDDNDDVEKLASVNSHETKKESSSVDYYKLYDDIPEEVPYHFDFVNPPPESFYKIVPDTPLIPGSEHSKQNDRIPTPTKSPRKVAYKKQSRMRQLGRTLSIRRTERKQKPKKLQKSGRALERSSSWPSVNGVENEDEVSPYNKVDEDK